MAMFGAPVALEDHAIRACLAGLAIQDEANRLAVEVQDRDRIELHDRPLRPLLATGQPPAPPPLRKALHAIDIHITESTDQARLLTNAA
jgi:hypothetical protein